MLLWLGAVAVGVRVRLGHQHQVQRHRHHHHQIISGDADSSPIHLATTRTSLTPPSGLRMGRGSHMLRTVPPEYSTEMPPTTIFRLSNWRRRQSLFTGSSEWTLFRRPRRGKCKERQEDSLQSLSVMFGHGVASSDQSIMSTCFTTQQQRKELLMHVITGQPIALGRR